MLMRFGALRDQVASELGDDRREHHAAADDETEGARR
jgi:hypothetical protein